VFMNDGDTSDNWLGFGGRFGVCIWANLPVPVEVVCMTG